MRDTSILPGKFDGGTGKYSPRKRSLRPEPGYRGSQSISVLPRDLSSLPWPLGTCFKDVGGPTSKKYVSTGLTVRAKEEREEREGREGEDQSGTKGEKRREPEIAKVCDCVFIFIT